MPGQIGHNEQQVTKFLMAMRGALGLCQLTNFLAQLIEHLLDIGEDVAAEGLRQGDLDGFYKQANAKFKDSEEFQERARARVVLLQGGDEATLVLWRRLVEMSNAYFNRVYTKLDVLLTDDDLDARLKPLVDRLVQLCERH